MIRSRATPPGRALRVLVAPDSFKGTIAASDVAAALSRGLRSRGLAVDECPVADGGEGTVAALVSALGGELRTASVADPLGRVREASWVLMAGGATAALESAEASGLRLLAARERDAERASSVGTGELILAAVAAGARRVIVAIGGTATSDGGAGALAVIDAHGGLGETQLVALCDVDIEFERAARDFAPQKGADAAAVARLQRRLAALAAGWPRDPHGVAMTGAGGGLAGGLWACHGAELRRGAEFVLDALGFAARLRCADAVVVGEGRLDSHSLRGKAPCAIARLAGARGVPVHAVVGGCTLGAPERAQLQLVSVREAGTPVALERAGADLADELLLALRECRSS
jgi:glycerate kinase